MDWRINTRNASDLLQCCEHCENTSPSSGRPPATRRKQKHRWKRNNWEIETRVHTQHGPRCTVWWRCSRWHSCRKSAHSIAVVEAALRPPSFSQNAQMPWRRSTICGFLSCWQSLVYPQRNLFKNGTTSPCRTTSRSIVFSGTRSILPRMFLATASFVHPLKELSVA